MYTEKTKHFIALEYYEILKKKESSKAEVFQKLYFSNEIEKIKELYPNSPKELFEKTMTVQEMIALNLPIVMSSDAQTNIQGKADSLEEMIKFIFRSSLDNSSFEEDGEKFYSSSFELELDMFSEEEIEKEDFFIKEKCLWIQPNEYQENGFSEPSIINYTYINPKYIVDKEEVLNQLNLSKNLTFPALYEMFFVDSFDRLGGVVQKQISVIPLNINKYSIDGIDMEKFKLNYDQFKMKNIQTEKIKNG